MHLWTNPRKKYVPEKLLYGRKECAESDRRKTKPIKMAPVRGDGMRGLAVFISDIRNCKLSLALLDFDCIFLLI